MGYDDIDDDDPDDFRPTAEDGDMIDVMSGGKQTGFADVFRNLVGSQLLSVNLPPWRARDWTVTLGAMKVDGSQGANLVPGFPPDNEVSTTINFVGTMPPDEVRNYDIAGLYVRVWWGTGNSREGAYVSWPWGGLTLQLHGADVRVELPGGYNLDQGNPGTFLPLLQGFISPGCRRDGGMLSPPTLITKTKSMGSAAEMVAGVDFAAPPRACGYRLYTHVNLDNLVVGFNPQVVVSTILWQGGLPAPLASLDATNASLYRGNSSELEVGNPGSAWNRATGQPNDWRRFSPLASGLHVSIPNGVNGTNIDVGVEWILDIG